MDDRQQKVKQRLDELAGQPGLLGAALVSRDGLPVLDSSRRPLNSETFSAMSATVMGAAEAALSELSENRVARVIADADRMRLVLVGVTDEFLLVAIAEGESELQGVIKRVEKASQDIAKAITDGK